MAGLHIRVWAIFRWMMRAISACLDMDRCWIRSCSPFIWEQIRYGGNQGTIYYDEGGLIGQLGVFLFEDTGALERNGEGLFVGAQGTAAQDAEVLNGYLERSNTDIVKQMTEMITYQLQSAAQVSKMYDQLMTKAATEIGRM